MNPKSSLTLDSQHTVKLNEFYENKQKKLPILKQEKNTLKKELELCNDIEKRLDIKDKIKKINKEIKQIKKEKKDYLLDNSKFIFPYFEKKKQLSEGKHENKNKILHSFFKKDKKIKVTTSETESYKYLINVNKNMLDLKNYTIDYEFCKCGGEFIKVNYKGLVICNKCGIQKTILIEHQKPSYKEPPKEVCFYAYKRINHFREILAQFQAKETTQIPDNVFENIKNQIKKERISLKHMTNKKAKDILKKLGYNKYYEHIPFIKDKLGIRPPVMSPELEERLCNLFMEIQKPYAKHCPDDRVNFLNYYYVLYKMCELLNENKFLPFFPMLKDPVKRIEQDQIWKKICKELNWEFVPTI